MFYTKALRQEHQKETHPEEPNDPVLREVDDAMWKRIKDNLKIYTDNMKRRRPSSDPDADRENWVLANTPRYEAGRSTKFNSKLELGQWYTIFTTLAPNTKVSDHPCELRCHKILTGANKISLRLWNSSF